MRLATALFSLLFTLLTVPSFAQGAECVDFAKSVVSVATNGRDAKLVAVVNESIENPASGTMEKVEILVFSTGASEITVEVLPSYYSAGRCELKSLRIVRE